MRESTFVRKDAGSAPLREEHAVSDPPASPRASRLVAPGWLDTRLVLGVLLVLASVVVGARVLSSADRSQTVWVLTRDLAPGAELTGDDLTVARVRLFTDGAEYISGHGPAPVGYFLRRAVGARELLPVGAITPPGKDVNFRSLTVPVSRGHLPPDLRAGTQVDVYVSPVVGPGSSTAAGPPRLVLRNVTVLLRPESSGFSGATTEESIVLQVRPTDVPTVLAAVSQGRIDLVGVPRFQEKPVATVPAEDG